MGNIGVNVHGVKPVYAQRQAVQGARIFRPSVFPLGDVVLFGARPLKDRVEKHYPVVVVGGGAAGLTAMYDLVKRRGVDAVLLESMEKLGGVAQSAKSPAGVPHPAGATIFLSGNPEHEALWQELKIPLDEKLVLKPEIMVLKGERFTAFSLKDQPLDVPPESKRAKKAAKAFQKFLKDLAEIAKSAAAPVIPIQKATKKALAKWDGISLAKLFKKYDPIVKTLAEPYIKSDLAADSRDVSAYVGMIDLEDLNHARMVLPGGNGYVMKRLTEEVRKAHQGDGDPLQTSHVVEWLEQDGEKVYLKYRDAEGKKHVVSADHVLMAAPYQAVPKLMELPKKVVKLMKAIPKSSYSIVNLYFKNTPLKTHQFYMLPESKHISDLVLTGAEGSESREPGEGPSVMSIYTAHTGRFKDKKGFGKKIAKEILETFPEIKAEMLTEVVVNPFEYSMAAPSPGQVKALAQMPRTYGKVTLINSDGGAVPSILTAVDEAMAGTKVADLQLKAAVK